MASLIPGVLMKLLRNMDSDEETVTEKRSPLLQIISIIPMLSGPDLWPNQGFYLKISDSLHATYVSVPPEFDEMILSDKLQLGQFIHVQKLEFASSVPSIRGLKPLPGRHPCIGSPKDLIIRPGSSAFPVQLHFCSHSNAENFNDLFKDEPEKPRSSSASKIGAEYCMYNKKANLHSGPTSPVKCMARQNDEEERRYDVVSELAKICITCVDEDSDSDSSRSSCSFRPKAPRRSWDKGTITRIKARLGSCAVKQEARPLVQTCTTDALQSQNTHSSKDDLSTYLLTTGRRNKTLQGHRPVTRSWSASICSDLLSCEGGFLSKGQSSDYTPLRKLDKQVGLKMSTFSTTQKTSSMGKACRENSPLDAANSPACAADCGGGEPVEGGTMWASLPSCLGNLGKDVARHRDTALFAAVEALQEAAAAERMTSCLSTYSELQSNKVDEPYSIFVRFLKLNQDLAEARKITGSLVKSRAIKTSHDDACTTDSCEAGTAALDRKKHAASWVKAAVASDLSPYTPFSRPLAETSTKRGAVGRSQNSVGLLGFNQDCDICLGTSSANESLEWIKGSGAVASADLGEKLQRECKAWFLHFVTKFLDDLQNRVIGPETDTKVAGLICLLKQVDGWLSMKASREAYVLNERPDEVDEIKALYILRKKIYDILLDNIGSSVISLESRSTTAT